MGVGVLFALGLWSKETAVVALPILLLESGLKNGKDKLPWKDAAVAGLPLALALGIRFWMGGVGEGGEALGTRGLLALSALGHYLQLLAWPGDLTVQVGARILEGGEEVFPLMPLIGGGAFVLLVGGLWWKMGQGGDSTREGRGDLLWLVFPLLPVLHLLPLGTPWVASARYLYLPLLGVAALVARGMSREVPQRLPLLVGVVIGLFGLSSTFHTLNFQTDEDLWTHESELHSDSATAWENLGHALYRQERRDDAVEAWRKGVQEVPAWNEGGRERLGLLLLREVGSGLKPWQQDELKRQAQFYTDLLNQKEVPFGAWAGVEEEGTLRLKSVDDPELLWIPAGQAAQWVGQFEEAEKRFVEGIVRRASSQLLWAERQRTAALEGDWSRVATLFQEARQALMNPDWGKEWQGQLGKGQQMAANMPLPPDAPVSVGEVLKNSRVYAHFGAPHLAYGALDALMDSGGEKVVSFWVTRIQLDVSQGAMERALLTLGKAREAIPEARGQWDQFETQLQGQMRRGAQGR